MPAIAPDRLLSCLAPLLDKSDGSIKSDNEVDKIVGLMTKFSKKLVSKCTYINILRATSPPVLDRFMDRGGWELVYNWTNESIESNNFPLLYEICSLLLYSPCSIARMKENDLPKKIKTLSKECQNEGLKAISNDVVNKWISIAKNGDTATIPSSSAPVASNSKSLSSSTASISSPSQVVSSTTSTSISSSIPVPMQGKPQIIKLTSPTNQQKVIGGQYCAISNTDGTKLFLKLKPKEEPEVICLTDENDDEVEKDKNLIKQDDANDEVEIIENDVNDDASKTSTPGKKQKRARKLDPIVEAKIDQTIEDAISQVSSTSTIDSVDSKKEEEKEKAPIKLIINKNKISPTKGTTTASTKKPPAECSIDTSLSNEAETNSEAGKDKKKAVDKMKDTTNKELKKEKKKLSSLEEPKEKKTSPSKDKESSKEKKESKEKKTSPSKEPKEKKSRKSGSKTIELAKQAAEEEKLSKKIHEEKRRMKERAKEAEKEKQRVKDEETLKSVLGAGSMKTLTGKIPKKQTSFEDALGGGSGSTAKEYKLVTHVIKKKPSIDEKDKDKNKEKEKSSTASPIVTEVPARRPVRIKVPPSKFRTEDIIHDMMYNQKPSQKTKPTIDEEPTSSSTTATPKTSEPMDETVKAKPIKRLSSIELAGKGNSPIESKKPKLAESLEKIVVSKEKKKESSIISPTVLVTAAQSAKDKIKAAAGYQESSLFMDMLNSSASTKSEKLRKRRPSISTIVASTISSEPQKSKSPKEEKPITTGGHFFYKEREEDSPPEQLTETTNDKDKSSSLDLEAAIAQDMKEDKDNEAKGFLPDSDDYKLKSSLIYLHKSGKAKKKVQFRDEDNLVETRFFEYDENERVNVHKVKEMQIYLEAHGISMSQQGQLPAGLGMGMKRDFNELKKNEMTMERKSIGQRKRFSPQDRMDEKAQWRRPRLVNVKEDVLLPNVVSQEKQVQESRLSQILEVIYFPGNPAPDCPAEPDNVIVEEVEPRIMPVDDIQGVTNVTDYSTQAFPPSFSQQKQQQQQQGLGVGPPGPGLINPNMFATNFGLSLPTNFNPGMMQQQMPMQMPNPFNIMPQMDMTRPPIFNMPPQFTPNSMMTGPPPSQFGFGQPPPQMMGHGGPPGNFNNFNGPPPANMNMNNNNNGHRQISPRDSQQQQQHRGSNNNHRGGAVGGRGGGGGRGDRDYRDRGDRDYRVDRDRHNNRRDNRDRDRDRRDSSRPSSRAPALCRFFQKGNCREGKSCTYSHESPARSNNSSHSHSSNNNKISPPKRNDENSEGSTTTSSSSTDSPKQTIESSNIMALTSSSNTDIIMIEPKTRPTLCRTISNQSDEAAVTHFAQPPESPSEASIPPLTPAVVVGAGEDDLLPPGCD